MHTFSVVAFVHSHTLTHDTPASSTYDAAFECKNERKFLQMPFFISFVRCFLFLRIVKWCALAQRTFFSAFLLLNRPHGPQTSPPVPHSGANETVTLSSALAVDACAIHAMRRTASDSKCTHTRTRDTDEKTTKNPIRSEAVDGRKEGGGRKNLRYSKLLQLKNGN